MAIKGFVTVGFLSFGIGALLAFVFNVDAENITILSVAAIAGLLSYMTIFVAEENKNSENVLDEIKRTVWVYLESVDKHVLNLAFKLVELEEVRSRKERLDELAELLKSGKSENKDDVEFESEFEKMKEYMPNHFKMREDAEKEKRSCTIKGLEVFDALNTYELTCHKDDAKDLDEVKGYIIEISEYLKVYHEMDDLFVDKGFLKAEDEILDTIGECQLALRRCVTDIKLKHGYRVMEKKKEILVYVYVIVLSCFGYLVSESYKVI